jgi:hypothetical protein
MRFAVLIPLVYAACLPLPPDHTYDDERHVTLDWSLKGPENTTAQCPSGYDTVLVAACVDEDLYQCFSANAACDTTGSETLTVYTSGRYRPDSDSSFFDLSTQYWVYFALTDPTGETVYSSSQAARVDLAAGDKTVEAAVYPDSGFLRLEWDLSSAASGSSASRCSELDVDEIELQYAKYTSSDPPLTEKVRWPCTTRASMDPDADSPGDGDSPALDVGSYIGDVVAYRAGTEIGRYEDLTFDIHDRGQFTKTSAYIEITDR